MIHKTSYFCKNVKLAMAVTVNHIFLSWNMQNYLRGDEITLGSAAFCLDTLQCSTPVGK